MKFVGFNFKKINVERFSEKIEGLKINTQIDLAKIELIDSSGENKIIKTEFNYIVNYDSEFAKIELSGEIFISGESKLMQEIIEKWEKEKILPEDFRIFLFNILLRKSNLKALQLEDEMNLPLHLPLPTIKKEDKKE